MEARMLKYFNFAVIVLIAAWLYALAVRALWGSVALGLWSAAPMLVFVAPVLATRDPTGQRCMLVAMAGFGLLAIIMVTPESRPTDPFSVVGAWVVPAALFVAATLAASVGAIAAKLMRGRPR